MGDKRTAVLNLIKGNKEILFGKFSSTLSHEDKEKKWKEIAMYAQALGVLDPSKDWRYCRDVVWQNWRKRTIDKIEKRNRFGSSVSKRRKLDESDMLILEIVGRDSPERLPAREPAGAEIKTNIQLKKKPQKNIECKESKEELEKHILRMKVEILKREAYIKDLEIYRKEMELGLPISEFTEKFYKTADDDDGQEEA